MGVSQRPAFEARDYFSILPPMAGATGTTPAVIALSASNSQVTIDLTTLPGSHMNDGLPLGNDIYNPNPTGHFLFMQPDGGDVYVAFGPSVASLTTSNALSTSAVSTVSNNAVTQVAGGTLCLKNGVLYRFKIPKSQGTRDDADVGASSPARFLGFIMATGTATLRLYQGSP